MPPKWGARYFEEQPPDKDPETPSDNKQARFHQVFGNRKVRTFQRRAGRGRGNFRGRGPRNQPNSFSSRRVPDQPHDVPDVEGGHKQFHNDTRPRSIFSTSGKRPAFPQRDSGGKKRKRYVPGGLIPKFKRIEEYKGGTYCDVCNEGFRDVNAKALHDRSYKHRRNYGFLRHENGTKRNDDVDTITNTCQASEEDRKKNIEDGVTAFVSINLDSLPKAFREWISRSLAAAKQAADEAKDPSLLQAVQREIVDVYRVNDANCTLRRVCWTRRELASGSAYRTSDSKPATLPIIPDANVHIKDVPESKKEEEPKVDKPRSGSSPRSPRKDIVVEIADDVQTESPSVTQSPPDAARPTSSGPVLSPDQPQYRVVEVRWRTSRAAEMLQFCCQTRDREGVLANYYDVFGKPKGRNGDADLEQEVVEPTESLMTTFRGLRRQFESEDYEYDDLMHSMSAAAKEFEKGGKHIQQLRNLHQMQIQIALQAGEFRDCFEPCSRYVRTYSLRRPLRGRSVRFVGHWLVSLLFKNKPEGSRKSFPVLLEVAQEMRKFPEGAIEDIWVYEAIQAVKAVLINNWCGFFGRSLSSIVHCQGSTSKQILEGLVPFMREKALVVMTCMNIRHMRSTAMTAPPAIRIDDIRSLLGWDSSNELEDSIAETKDFVSSLPQRFEIVREHDNSDWMRWGGASVDDLTLSCDSDVKEGMLAKWGKPVVLEDE